MYAFNPNKPELACKSSGYSVYSEMFKDGVFWTPKYELYSARFMAGSDGVGKVTAGDQWICKADEARNFGPQFHCTAVWFHGLRYDELEQAAAGLWINFDRFLPDYEVPPTA